MNRSLSGQSRREHLAAWLRYGILGAIGATGGLAVAKRCRLVSNGICVNDGLCRGCPVLADCGLPEASVAKALVEKGSHGPKK